MDNLVIEFQSKIAQIPVRYLIDQIGLNNRLIAIKGKRYRKNHLTFKVGKIIFPPYHPVTMGV